MSVRINPYIETNGLVFCYDMSNTQKSWKGKPTTNYVITKVENFTGWTGAGWWMHPGNTTSVTTQDLPDGSIGPVLNATALSTGGLYGYNGYALGAAYASGTQYTVSFWARAFDGTASINVRDADSGGTLSSAVSGITNVWKRFSFTWTANASTNMLTFTGTNFSLYNVQLEINSFATPFVVGTRSNTQALLDLTGRNSVTANSLTYASDNTFSFNGTTDYVDTGNTFTFTQSGQFSAEVWLKILDHSDRPAAAAGIIGKGHYYDNQWDIWLYNNNSIYFETTGNPTRQGLVYLATPVLALNTWHHYVATYNNGAKSIYLNGVLMGTQTYTGPGDFSNANNVLIGRRFGDSSRSLRGSVSVAKIYNRALSAAEVRQNFYAHKGRYGL